MPRTTLDIDSAILRELRERAEREGKSMGQVASELLAGALTASSESSSSLSFRWTSADLGAPRVDLEDKEALHGLLDGRA